MTLKDVILNQEHPIGYTFAIPSRWGPMARDPISSQLKTERNLMILGLSASLSPGKMSSSPGVAAAHRKGPGELSGGVGAGDSTW